MTGSSACPWQWWIVTVAWGCLLLYLCLSPAPPSLPGPLGWDKLSHAVALGIMSYFVARSRQGSCHQALSGFAFGTVFGILIELLQGFLTSNREADLYDVLADMLGAGIAALIFYCLHARKTE